MRYYAVQYGSFWVFTRAKFCAFLRHGASGQSWDLDNFGTQLRRTPKGIRRSETSRRPYNVTDPEVVLIQPLDWQPEDFVYALDGIRAQCER